MVVSKEDELFKTSPNPKVRVQLCWISLFSKFSWIKTTASGLSYELAVNREKKVNENWDIINKNGHIKRESNLNSVWHCYLAID